MVGPQTWDPEKSRKSSRRRKNDHTQGIRTLSSSISRRGEHLYPPYLSPTTYNPHPHRDSPASRRSAKMSFKRPRVSVSFVATQVDDPMQLIPYLLPSLWNIRSEPGAARHTGAGCQGGNTPGAMCAPRSQGGQVRAQCHANVRRPCGLG